MLVYVVSLLITLERVGSGSTHAVGSSTSISLVALEDGGIRLGDLVLASTGDHTTLDTQSSGVATSVTSRDCDLAMGGDERGGGEGDEEDLGEHFDCFGVVISGDR